jgi:hypothetical protein
MIGKNAGIRRARGEFVLATNIDILFSPELIAFMAKRALQPEKMYRIDRYDVMSDVPIAASPEEQNAYCREHLLRVNRRDGTFVVGCDGKPALGRTDVTTPDCGVLFGEGWYAPERYGSREIFRWARQRSMLLADPPAGAEVLVLDVDPGPGIVGGPLEIEIRLEGEFVARLQVQRRSRIRLRAAWNGVKRVEILFHGNAVPISRDPRTLIFRVLRVEWEHSGGSAAAPEATVHPISAMRRLAVLREGLRTLVARLAYSGPVVDVTVPVSPSMQRVFKLLAGSTRLPKQEEIGPLSNRVPPLLLHTNACGDFTLVAKERWLDLRGYPEFDMYSMNVDSVFCYAAHHGGATEEFLPDPMRIYHIEHGAGSGWTPEGQVKLYERLARAGISWLDGETLLSWGGQMRQFNSPMVFNRDNWGLADYDLPETVLPRPAGS